MLCDDTYLANWVVVLNLRGIVDGRGRSLLLFPSAIGAERFRRLLVRLRLARGSAVVRHAHPFKREG
jgi:hypothetical protein